MGPEILRQLKDSSAEKPESHSTVAARKPCPKEFFTEICNAVIRGASTIQYESATLSAIQIKQQAPAEKFTLHQQGLSRLAGGEEIDGMKRDLVQPMPEGPLGHLQQKRIMRC